MTFVTYVAWLECKCFKKFDELQRSYICKRILNSFHFLRYPTPFFSLIVSPTLQKNALPSSGGVVNNTIACRYRRLFKPLSGVSTSACRRSTAASAAGMVVRASAFVGFGFDQPSRSFGTDDHDKEE